MDIRKACCSVMGNQMQKCTGDSPRQSVGHEIWRACFFIAFPHRSKWFCKIVPARSQVRNRWLYSWFPEGLKPINGWIVKFFLIDFQWLVFASLKPLFLLWFSKIKTHLFCKSLICRLLIIFNKFGCAQNNCYLASWLYVMGSKIKFIDLSGM